MKCKKCGHIFEQGEMAYANSGNSPLCYPCAENGSLMATGCLALIVTIVMGIGLIIYRCSDDYKISKAIHAEVMASLNLK